MEKRSLKNLFFNPAWCIACRKINPDNGLFPDLKQEPFSVLLPTNTEWYADPMCFSDNGKTYIFVELMYCKNPANANIGVTEFKNGKFSAVKEIISEPFHMSYPNVFKYGEHYYMIPETSAANQLRLYESIDFPYQWKLKKILLDRVRLVDSSFMKIDDRRLLFFSYDINNKSSLRMFVLDQEDLSFKEIDRLPGASDERPGGNIITHNGERYRVLQDCSEEYGKKLKLYRITDCDIDQMKYSEEYLGEITIDTIPLNANRGFTKVHTYTRSGDHEVIDTLYNRFYINHPLRRIKYLFVKKPSYEFGSKPKLLYVVGQCLYNNTSANMSHNAFVKGFIENGYDVDIVMPEDSWGAPDSKLGKLNATYHTYEYYSFPDRVRIKYFSRVGSERIGTESGENQSSEEKEQQEKDSLRDIIKKHFYKISRGNSRYGNETHWLKKAVKYSSDSLYDLVVSNSSPEASHKLVIDLLKKERIKCKRWVQIWEDPWYYDLYGGHLEADREEEHQLLRSANEIYYVSPLTLMYQKQHYSDCAHKMKCVPLPFLEFSNKSSSGIAVKTSFGYFGDYYSYTRNLKPFYEALLQSGYKGYIFGDTDLALKSNDKIEISGRVTLDVLEQVQDKTEVLVHLSNLQGGQIPGKIFHYSATDKPILFILDGTKEEIAALREFFGKYDRYYFCENNAEQILLTMKKIVSEDRKFEPVSDFKPENVVRNIILSD